MQGVNPNQTEQVFKEKIEPMFKEAGFDFTYKDMLDFEASMGPDDDGKLGDDALKAAAGSRKTECNRPLRGAPEEPEYE